MIQPYTQKLLKYRTMKVKQISLPLVSAFSLIFILSCTVKYLPVTNGITTQNGYAVLVSDSHTIAIRHKPWNLEPSIINSYYSTFHVMVRNTSREIIDFSLKDLVLVDSHYNQYDTVKLQDILDIYQHDNFYSPTTFAEFEHYKELQQTVMNNRRNIIQNTLTSGSVFPNAQRTGFIFFNKLSADDDFSVYYKNVEIKFRKITSSPFRK